MYQSHWGLRETPFSAGQDPRRFFQSPIHEEALARLHFLVEQRRRLGVLLGPHGCGKSLLLEVFADQMQREGYQTASVSLLGLDATELVGQITTQMGVNLAASSPLGVLWRALTDRIREFRYQQQGVVVLLDEADQASSEALTHVTRLAQHDWSPDARLTLVLASPPEQLGHLGGTLLELAELRIDLEPWEAADTAAFVIRALTQAGSERTIFTRPALVRLHELTQGIPRRVSQLADLALLAGAGDRLEEIDVGVVEAVYQELGVVCV